METTDANDEICGHHDDSNGADESGIISDLSSTTEKPPMLDAPINPQQLNERNQCKENDRISDQNNELMKILIRKENKIKNMATVIEHMERQVQSAVSAKLDALARLETIQGRELTLRFKEKQMDLDAERVSNTIENLTDNLNKNVTELMAVRHELASASAQFEIESNRKFAELKMANLNICELSETNGLLKTQNEDYAYKLQQQLNESGKLMELYEMDLKAKIELAELYKENSDDYRAQVDELTAATTELKAFINEIIDGYGMLETEVKEMKLDRQAESNAKDAVIGKLKQELEDANRLLKAYQKCDDGMDDVGMDGKFINSPISNNHPMVERMTFTEMYTQYCSVVKALQHKEQECEILETEMKKQIKDVMEKSIDFDQQQRELKNLQTANDKMTQERNNFLVTKMVGRAEIEHTRSRCELLTAENNELKSMLKCYETDCLKKMLSTNRGIITKLAYPETVELEQRNRQLLFVCHELIAKIQEMNSVEVLTSEIYEVSDGNESTNMTSCHKSVQVPEADLMTDGRDIPNVKSQESNIEELAQKNNKLKADVQKLRAEKYLLVAEANLFKARVNVRKNQQYVNKVLSDANVQTDTGIESHEESTSAFTLANITTEDYSAVNKNTFLHSLQLTKSNLQQAAAECAKPNRLKRPAKDRNTCDGPSSSISDGCSKRLRSKKKPRVEFLDLSEDSDEDEIIIVCEDGESGVSPNAEVQLLSEMRTRQQAKFIHDAFRGQKIDFGVQLDSAVEVETPNEKKVSRPQRARSHSSRGSRSSTRAGRAQNSNRSSSVGSQQSPVCQESDSRSSAGQQTSTCGNPNGYRRSRRLMSRV